MYNIDEYKNLTLKYGSYASWAIWDYKDESNSLIIDKYIEQLNSKFVFLGLNISRSLTNKPWINFHGGRNDRKIKYACNDNKLRGSYITDIFKDMPATIAIDLQNNLTDKDINKNVLIFNREMENIKINKSTHFILFGNLTAYYFNKYFKQNFTNKITNYFHYSRRGTDRAWVTGLWKKLNINQNFDQTIKKYK